MKKSLLDISRKGKPVLVEAEKDCREFIEEWWAWVHTIIKT